jgi:hypothetical protein
MPALFETLLAWRSGYAMGDGELGRTLRDLQRKHFQPPNDADAGVLGTRHKLYDKPRLSNQWTFCNGTVSHRVAKLTSRECKINRHRLWINLSW